MALEAAFDEVRFNFVHEQNAHCKRCPKTKAACNWWAGSCRSLRTGLHKSDTPHKRFHLQAVANGDSSAALSVASIFAQTFSQPATGSSLCQPESASAAARERILESMLKLDSVTYSSSTYILQARQFAALPY